MDIKSIDEKMRESLMKHTEGTNELKEEIWNHIEQELFEVEASTQKELPKHEEKVVQIKKKRKKSFVPFLITTAAATILFFGVQTQPGLALIDQIKQMFVPEKENTQTLEGIEEKTGVTLEKGLDSSYVIYVDEERYQFVQGKESDQITFKGTLPEGVSKVYMDIKQEKNKTPEQLKKEVEAQFKQSYQEVYGIGNVTEPMKGWRIMGKTGNEWNSSIERVYVVSNQKQGSFIITQHYFLEAEEGHGVRFDDMLKDFHIITEKKGDQS